MQYDDDFVKWYTENEEVLEEILKTDDTMSYMRDFLAEFPALKEMYWNKLWKSGEAKKLIPRKGNELIFCTVRFSPGSRKYRYLVDEDIYREGDTVIVPAGEDNHESTAKIVSVEYHTAEEAPFPLNEIKRIIRKQ